MEQHKYYELKPISDPPKEEGFYTVLWDRLYSDPRQFYFRNGNWYDNFYVADNFPDRTISIKEGNGWLSPVPAIDLQNRAKEDAVWHLIEHFQEMRVEDGVTEIDVNKHRISYNDIEAELYQLLGIDQSEWKRPAIGVRWVSIEDRMPEDKIYVMAWVPSRKMSFMVYRENGVWVSRFDGIYEGITHWASIPTLDESETDRIAELEKEVERLKELMGEAYDQGVHDSYTRSNKYFEDFKKQHNL